MSFTDLGQVLQLQGGAPQLMSGSVFSENLSVTKSVTSPTPGAMVPGLVGAGLSTIMQNPMAAIVSQVTSSISGLSSLLTGSSPATLSAIVNLVSSVGDLGSSAAMLSGVQDAPPGAYGHDDLTAHYRSVKALGLNPPAALSRDTAAAPLTSGAALTTAAQSADATVRQVASGTSSDSAGAAALVLLAATIDGIVDASDDAIQGLRAAIPALAAAAAIGGVAAAAVASRSSSLSYSDPDVEALDDLYKLVVRPEAYSALKTAALAASYVPPPKLQPVAPTIPINNVALKALITVTPSGTQTIEVI